MLNFWQVFSCRKFCSDGSLPLMKKYIILYLNHVSYIGGAEIALLNLLMYLDRDRYTPVAFVPAGELAERIQQLNIPCVHIPVLDGLNRYTLPHFISVFPQLVSYVFRENPDLLHANTNFMSQYSGVLSKLTKIPSVGHIRDIEPLGRMGRWIIRQNTKLIAISDAVKRYLVGEHILEHQIVRVHDGVDLRQYQSQKKIPPFLKGRRGDFKTAVIVGVIGQIGKRKGHLYFLEAAQMIVQTYPDVVFWIVGKEPAHSKERYTEQLYQYVQDNRLEQYVTFWGFRADIPEILAQLDILVLPSLQEPFGKIVIEAMAMEKPVVASNVGGVPEIVVDGKTGFLVPPGNSDTLRQALEQLIPDREKREKMGREGRKRVEQMFTLEKNVRATEQVYQDILVR
jgi:glycosyltransferase involved in cell wall biosynthesis